MLTPFITDLTLGLILWRGYFQSVRPAMNRMLINIDISTGTMYKEGPLISLCLEVLGQTDPHLLEPKHGLPDRERLRLQRFIAGIRVVTPHPGPGPAPAQQTPRVVKKLSMAGASNLQFTMREGGTMTVAEYFRRTQNRPLQFPDMICAEVCQITFQMTVSFSSTSLQVGSGALIPLELCKVPPGLFSSGILLLQDAYY